MPSYDTVLYVPLRVRRALEKTPTLSLSTGHVGGARQAGQRGQPHGVMSRTHLDMDAVSSAKSQAVRGAFNSHSVRQQLCCGEDERQSSGSDRPLGRLDHAGDCAPWPFGDLAGSRGCEWVASAGLVSGRADEKDSTGRRPSWISSEGAAGIVGATVILREQGRTCPGLGGDIPRRWPFATSAAPRQLRTAWAGTADGVVDCAPDCS